MWLRIRIQKQGGLRRWRRRSRCSRITRWLHRSESSRQGWFSYHQGLIGWNQTNTCCGHWIEKETGLWLWNSNHCCLNDY
jgi:hypothetical protein